MKKRVLFLDVDGVLNNRKSMIAASEGKHPPGEVSHLTMDPDAVALLQEVVSDLGIELVLSSVWRMSMIGVAKTSRVMRWAGWKGRPPFIGVTDEIGRHRGTQIQRWLDARSDIEDIEYVIVDDDSDMLPSQMHRFVHTNNIDGLTKEKAKEIRDLFMKE
jgi:phosphoglycolate phosphatase-like HAD superfamily hydrolase